MAKPIKAIIFDYAGVLTPTEGFDDFIASHKDKLQKTKEEYYYYFKKNWSTLSIGKGDLDIYWTELAKDLGLTVSNTKKMVLDTFPLNRELLTIVKKLKNNYTTVLMSNQIKGWIENELVPERVEDYFTHNFSSYIIGIKKPDTKAYQYVLNSLKLDGAECLYFDDQQANLDAASQLGINSVKFTRDSNINQELEKFNIY